jgi:hypothetical protein
MVPLRLSRHGDRSIRRLCMCVRLMSDNRVI